MKLRPLSCAGLLALLVAPLGAQSLPPTPPTANVPAPAAATPTAQDTKHAEVTYAAGLLNVRADDSSLNQILRQIAELTGMKITGGVTDIPIFGNYGPATPSTILATLLNGTGSNMLLRQSDTTGAPLELVLTPRHGGPTPPSPTDSSVNDRPRPLLPQRMYTPPPNRMPPNRMRPDRFAPNHLPHQVVADAPDNFPPATPNAASPGSTTSSNPNGISTPEDIYQRLKAIREKAAQRAATTPK